MEAAGKKVWRSSKMTARWGFLRCKKIQYDEEMEKKIIHIPGKRKTSTWQIPVLQDSREREAMNDFDSYEAILTAYGFTRIHATRSIPHPTLSYLHEKKKTHDYVLWQHAAGILAHGHSYTRGGYTDSDGTSVPVTKTLGSITIETYMDCGTGAELQHRAGVHCGAGGSGGTLPQLDGSDIRRISNTFHSNTTLFKDFLTQSQPYGRFLPLDQWPMDEDIRKLYLPNEFALPLDKVPATTPNEIKTFLESQDYNLLWEQFTKKLPPNIQRFFGSERKLKQGDNPPQRKGLRWDPVELSLKQFSEALFFSKKRWRGSFDSEILTHWSRAALGELGDNPDEWRPYEKGPAGLSLPIALLYAKPGAKKEQAFLDLLRTAPLDVLDQWATKPDAAGYTLGLHIINRVFSDRILTHKLEIEVILGALDILHERLGSKGLPMATATRSVMGLPLQFCPDMTPKEKTWAETQQEFLQVIKKLEEWGLDWNIHLRWRNYPNLFRDKEKPTFFAEDGPVTGNQWLNEMGEKAMNGAHAVATLLQAHELNIEMPASTPTTSGNQRVRM